ncbi:MAG: SDR family oxidoreductase [Alphaproteobacteria bacterium]
MPKNVIITGSSSGIGAGIAKYLGAHSNNIVVNYAGNEAEAEAVVELIKSSGGNAISVKGDVTKPADISNLFDAAENAFGPVDALVNNAGRAVRKPLAELTDDDFATVFDTNVKGAFNAMREGARRIVDGGRIINISMSYQGAPIPGYGIYTASKAAVEQMTMTAAKELGSRHIRVNALRPGPTRTPLFLHGKTPDLIKQFEGMVALGRLGEPEDIARMVAFLISDEGGWITGQCIGVNGGYW